MALAITHATPADGTFSVDGAAAWDAAHTLTGTASVSQGGTGLTSVAAGAVLTGAGTGNLVPQSTTAGRLMIGNGASGIKDSSNLLYDTATDKLSVGTTSTQSALNLAGSLFSYRDSVSGATLINNYVSDLGGFTPISVQQGNSNYTSGFTWLSSGLGTGFSYALGNVFLGTGSTDGLSGGSVASGDQLGAFYAAGDDGTGHFFCGSQIGGAFPIMTFEVAGAVSAGRVPVSINFWSDGLSTSGVPRSVINIQDESIFSKVGATLGKFSCPWKQLFLDNGVDTNTTSPRTINKATGRFRVAAGATTFTINNTLVTAGDTVVCQCITNDATCQVKNTVPAAGSFTVNLIAATGATDIEFLVINK